MYGIYFYNSLLATCFPDYTKNISMITPSLLSGIGISMNLLASISIVPSYFEKRKPAAYACTGLGEGIGLVAYPYIMSALIAKYEFKIGVLLVSPIIALSATSAIVFNPKAETLKLGRRGNATELVKTYFKPLRTFVAPFYLLNSYLWQGGLGGVILLLFNHVAAHTSTSVAVLCYSILGFGMLISTILYTLYLLKYSLNHYILEIVVNIAAGVTTIIIGLVGTDIAYYVLFGVMGLIYGLTIANIPCIASHVFEARHIEYAFGFYQICGGIGANVVTLTAGLLFEKYSALLSLCYVGGHIILAGIMLIIPAVMRPSIWKSKMSLPLNSDSNKEIDSTDSPIDPEAT